MTKPNGGAPDLTWHVTELRGKRSSYQWVLYGLERTHNVYIDTGGGHVLQVLHPTTVVRGKTKRRLRGFQVLNMLTGRIGNRAWQDITRSMRDRAKLRVLDALRELNRDVTTTVVNVIGSNI